MIDMNSKAPPVNAATDSSNNISITSVNASADMTNSSSNYPNMSTEDQDSDLAGSQNSDKNYLDDGRTLKLVTVSGSTTSFNGLEKPVTPSDASPNSLGIAPNGLPNWNEQSIVEYYLRHRGLRHTAEMARIVGITPQDFLRILKEHGVWNHNRTVRQWHITRRSRGHGPTRRQLQEARMNGFTTLEGLAEYFGIAVPELRKCPAVIKANLDRPIGPKKRMKQEDFDVLMEWLQTYGPKLSQLIATRKSYFTVIRKEVPGNKSLLRWASRGLELLRNQAFVFDGTPLGARARAY